MLDSRAHTRAGSPDDLSVQQVTKIDMLIDKRQAFRTVADEGRILLKAEVSELGEGWSDSEIAAAPQHAQLFRGVRRRSTKQMADQTYCEPQKDDDHAERGERRGKSQH